MARSNPRPAAHPGLRVIAVIKLLKAALLVLVAFGSYQLINRDLAEMARTWARHLPIDPENHSLRAAIARVSSLEPVQLRSVGRWSVFFAVDQVVEGLGLWYNQGWAKYLLLIVTPFFLVVEAVRMIVDLSHHRFSYFRLGSMTVAVGLIFYVLWILRLDRRTARAAS